VCFFFESANIFFIASLKAGGVVCARPSVRALARAALRVYWPHGVPAASFFARRPFPEMADGRGWSRTARATLPRRLLKI